VQHTYNQAMLADSSPTNILSCMVIALVEQTAALLFFCVNSIAWKELDIYETSLYFTNYLTVSAGTALA